ncbi:MAG: hypothetical protein L0211_17365 [Planctomycetaceae bacterium]|nr:hypothetical protein [Planctomycetaceae bacterium]
MADTPRLLRPWRIQFSLSSLLLFTTVCAWCSWQWTICERRKLIAQELLAQGNEKTFRDSTVHMKGVESICTSLLWEQELHDPMCRSFVGAISGWDNWDGLTVFVFSSDFELEQARLEQINTLSRLPGLTTVVLWDVNPETENEPSVLQFKKELRAKLPHVKINHVHTEPKPVG